jgi:peptidoglycan/xylan/chitin deacetylase (PgdA/CDA1 family)
MNRRVLRALAHNGAKAVGFVNEDKIFRRGEGHLRREILASWLDAGHELGNHTACHRKLAQETLEEFRRDVVEGEKTVNALLVERGGGRMRFFRYPYFNLGTAEQREPAREFLRKRGYATVGATIDPRDWEFNARLHEARMGRDGAEMGRIRAAFLRQLGGQLVAANGKSGGEILILHMCTLTAECVGEILRLARQSGYDFWPLGVLLGLDERERPAIPHRRLHHPGNF